MNDTTANAFSSLALKADLLDTLASLGFNTMTPIQAQSLPEVLQGKDIIAQAQTGSGKTVAFGLGLLQQLDASLYRVQSLVLCPTRELADQVAKEIRKLARGIHNIKVLTLCGGLPFGPQISSLEHGAHIVVGTPGRIEEHLRKRHLDLKHLNTLVLDEADRMLEMGFQATIDEIVAYAPAQRQNLLFSATYPEQIQSIATRILSNPVMVKVDAQHSTETIDQRFYRLDNHNERIDAIQRLLLEQRPDSTVVFCNTKRETQEIADAIQQVGITALALHGDLEQKMRDQILVRFANRSASVLVATDVAARGLDIDKLDAVINAQIARDLEVHIHRVGRTGRAGNRGIAHTLFTEKESGKLAALEKLIQQAVTITPLPTHEVFGQPGFKPPMITLQIDGGKKQKVRPGDILGALTGKQGIAGSDVGKIHLFDFCAYVAVKREIAADALHKLEKGKLKGRSFRVRCIRG